MKKDNLAERSKHKGKPFYVDQNQMTPEYVNWHFPIVSIKKYATGLQVQRGCMGEIPQASLEATRGKITHLSAKSLSRLAFLTRENSKMFNSLLTLTYGDINPKDGRQFKIELNRVLTYLRRKHKAQYVWFLEFTKRGRPHVHILLDHAPSIIDRFYLAEYWSNGVAINWPTNLELPFTKQVETRNKMFQVHFHRKAWEILRKKDGAARYVTKYATKLEQKTVPEHFQDVGRFWGASKEISLGDPEFEVDVTEADLREWLTKTMGRDLEHFDILPKFIYLFADDDDKPKPE